MEEINILVKKLRKISKEKILENKEILFIDNKFYLKEEYINISKLIHYIADMLEE